MTDILAPVALITGSARGIGKAIAAELLRKGAHVILLDIYEKEGRATLDELSPHGSVSFIAADVGNAEEVSETAARIAADTGRLDWIVNNAGLSFFRPLDEISVEEFDRVIDVNLRAAFLFAKFCAPLLRKSRCASIVNISSTRALMSEANNEAYAASKAGLLGLTHALSNSLGPTVRVNAICPGWIDVGKHTESLRPEDHSQHPAGRVGIPEDIAALCAFLLSAEASFITGQSFVVDGGMTKKMIYVE